MVVAVKICGITSEEALDAAIEAGADYAGFVFFKRSPRHLRLARAAVLAGRARGRIATVALTVNASYGLIKAIAQQVRPDFLQLHGSEAPARVLALRRLSKARIIKAVKVGTPADIAAAAAYEPVADVILFDAQTPKEGALPGGNGVAFDWSWVRKGAVRANFMLSGGLNSDNVRTAIDLSGAQAVDVSSGVESAPGVKNPLLIGNFVAAARSAVLQAAPTRAA